MRTRRYSYMVTHALLLTIGLIITLLVAKPDQLWSTFFVAVGTSIAATGIAGWTMWLYVSSQDKTAAAAKAIDKAGIDFVYEKRSAQIRNEYDSRLRRARKVDIMGFGLRQFGLDYMKQLGEISKRAKIRILVINPESPHASARDAEEGQTAGTIKIEAEEFIAKFRATYGQNSERLQMRVYDCLPMVNIFRVGRDIFWGPYLLDRNSGNTFTIRVRKPGLAYRQLHSHFQKAWDSAHVPDTLKPQTTVIGADAATGEIAPPATSRPVGQESS